METSDQWLDEKCELSLMLGGLSLNFTFSPTVPRQDYVYGFGRSPHELVTYRRGTTSQLTFVYVLHGQELLGESP